MSDRGRVEELREILERSGAYGQMRKAVDHMKGLPPDELLELTRLQEQATYGEIQSWAERLEDGASDSGAMALKNAGNIRMRERDYYLDLHNPNWPQDCPQGWTVEPDCAADAAYVFRTIRGDKSDIREYIIRFPSAPIYGIHRRDEYHQKLKRINYHTIRLLMRPRSSKKSRQIRRIYLFHNGLNEIDRVTHYYRLADALLDEESACLLRPFPGHLTRFPLARRFVEQPLDRYLGDASDLYRQYVRFMIETQWLLSILVPLRSYRVIAGLDLLAEGDEENEGRENAGVLAKAIFGEWRAAWNANRRAKRDRGEEVSEDAIESTVLTLRSLIGWKAWQPRRKKVRGTRDGNRVNLDSPPPRRALKPILHAVGYSLGGYLAQSVFFTWPFALGSCTTLCSGGALRDMELAKFAHPEEWHTVMQALRYEIESGMMAGRPQRWRGRVAGVDANYFRYLHHMFYEVFLQDFRGPYQSRVTEYLPRLFFILGGSDPIFSEQSVQAAAPEGGIHQWPVPQLGHLIWLKAEWQKLADSGALHHLGSYLSPRTENMLTAAVRENWWNQDRTQLLSRGGRNSRSEARDQALPSSNFLSAIGLMASMLADEGWLFIFRNQVPVTLLGRFMLHRDGATLYHSDDNIRNYVLTLQESGKAVEGARNRVTIVLPRRVKNWFTQAPAILSGNVETGRGGKPATIAQLSGIWNEFRDTWTAAGALRRFHPRPTAAASRDPLVSRLRNELGELPPSVPVVNTLPNAWFYFSREGVEALKNLASRKLEDRERVEKGFVRWAAELKSDGKQLKDWMKDEELIAVKVSASEFNPRYMGERIRSESAALELLVHSALCYLHSTKMR